MVSKVVSYPRETKICLVDKTRAHPESSGKGGGVLFMVVELYCIAHLGQLPAAVTRI